MSHLRAHFAPMGLTEVVRRLQRASHGELREIARDTGIPYSTIRRIKDGATRNPRLNTFEPLSSWLTRNGGRAKRRLATSKT